MTCQLGSQSLANIINSCTKLLIKSSLNELRDNSIDANASFIHHGLYVDENEILYYNLDNGTGMETNKLLKASTKPIKDNTKIGKFYIGGLNSCLSSNCDSVYIFSKLEDNPLSLEIYKISKMKNDVSEGFKNKMSGH